MSQQEDRAALVERIKELRQGAEEEISRLIEAHMEVHHPTATNFRSHAERCSIECDTWSERQKRSTYSRRALGA